MFLKNEKKEKSQNNTIILGMVMLADAYSISLASFEEDFTQSYSSEIEKSSGDNAIAVLTIAGAQIAIGHMPAPIPHGDLESTSAYAYNWESVLQEVSEHNSHLIVSVMGNSEDTVKHFKLFTQVVCALLRTTNSIGVYMGSQSLLIPKQDYLDEAHFMDEACLPLNLWIYFGLEVSDRGNSGYTYGLKEFGKAELEILDSSRSLEDIRAFLFNI